MQCKIEEGEDLLFTFQGQQRVVKAERGLKRLGLKVESRVTPSQLSTECGICLQVEASRPTEEIRTQLQEMGCDPVRWGELHEFVKPRKNP